MFDLGRGAAVEATLLLRARAAGEACATQLVVVLAPDGSLSTLDHPSQQHFTIELRRALDEGAQAAVAVKLDMPTGELAFIGEIAGREIPIVWIVTSRVAGDKIELSKAAGLHEDQAELRAGFYAGLHDSADAAGLIVDALPEKVVEVRVRYDATMPDPFYVDCGYAAGGVLADVVARRTGDRLAPEVVAANVENGEVYVERFPDLTAAVAAQRENRVRGNVILIVNADLLSLRVPAPEAPEHMRIWWDARYTIVDGRLVVKPAEVCGDNPSEMSAFFDGLEQARNAFVELGGIAGGSPSRVM